MSALPKTDIVRLRVPGDTRFLALIRTVVTSLARAAGFDENDVDKIEISVDEACTNALEHAYKHAAPKPPLDVEIHSLPHKFIVDVIDEGAPFDFTAYIPPKFPDHWISGQTRGVGLYLIQQCMDEARYEQLSRRTNRFRLVKNLPPAG